MSQKTTNAMRLLTQAGISFDTQSYEVDEADLSGTHVASQLGLPPEQVFKTLVARGEKNGIMVFCIPAAEELDFPDQSFDVVTACQCFWYFNHSRLMPNLARMLKNRGSILVLYMAWLPYEDEIAGASEELALKYNSNWSGAGETMHPIAIPDCYQEQFDLVDHEEYRISVPFTRESWNGRMKTCRGIGASLTEKEISMWEKEHRELLARIAPEKFEIQHYGALAELRKR